jgi:hypothetical protein
MHPDSHLTCSSMDFGKIDYLKLFGSSELKHSHTSHRKALLSRSIHTSGAVRIQAN